MRVALYARVSTTDQGQNPETQLYRLRELAKVRGWDIYKEYVDFASGKNPDRPQFKVLMEDVKQHRFDLIFVTRIDRMMRSTQNLFNVLAELEHYN
ncbi:MAG: recombinase family protein, partial [Methanomassiliicoccales archaeon]